MTPGVNKESLGCLRIYMQCCTVWPTKKWFIFNFYSCSFVLCHAVMRVKVLIRGPFTDLTLSPDRSHSCTFVTAEVKYRNRSGKLRQLFAILSRIICYRKKQNGPIIACQSTITLFAVLRWIS